MTACPTDAVLQQILTDQVTAEDLETLVSHIDTCTRCQEKLARMTEEEGGQLGLEAHHAANAVNRNRGAATPANDDGKPIAVEGFDILECLGRGGMGVVYKVRDRKLKRLVAMKMITPEGSSDPQHVLRFRSEAQAVARLHHPNIVPIFEIGEIDGRPFFCSEYVVGGTLARHLAGSPQPARAAVETVEILARAIDYAHSNGIVHRDLKPANILLSSEGGTRNAELKTELETGVSRPARHTSRSVPKIADFGLAKHIEDTSGLTQTGQVLGTPSYMAPEQALGNTSEVGPRTDVYALGAILYEMLTGRPPFKGATPLETLDQVRGSEPVPPSRLVPKLPRDVETICTKAMAKEPARRYQTAGQLGDDLRRYLNGEPIHARPVGRVEKSWRWCRRNPAVASLSAAVALALVAATIVSILFAVYSERAREKLAAEQAQTLRERDDKDAALQVERRALNLAVAALRDLTDDVVGEQMARGTELTDENKEFLRKIIQHFDGLAAIAADDAVSRIIRAEGLSSVALMRYRLGEMKEAEKAYSDSVALCRQLVAEFPESVDYRRKLAQAQYNFGMLLRDTGRLPDAEKCYAEALAIRRKLVEEDPKNLDVRLSLAYSLNNEGVRYSIRSQHMEAERAFADALKMYKELAEEFPERSTYREEVAGTTANLGNMYRATNHAKEAETAYNEALAIRKKLATENPKNTKYRKILATSHNSLGVFLRTAHRYKEAETHIAEALKIFERLANEFPSSPGFRTDLARSYNSLGNLYYSTDRLKEAETTFGDAVEVQRKLAADFPNQPDMHNNVAGTLGNLGVLCNKRRAFAAAKSYLDEAQPHHDAALKANPRHPHYRQYYSNNLITKVVSLAGLLDQSGALALAETIRDLGWDSPGNAYDAACALAKCVPIVEKTEGLDADMKRAAMKFYGDQAMAQLRDAVGKGFKDAKHMAADEDLMPLRHRDDFAQVLTQLSMKEKK